MRLNRRTFLGAALAAGHTPLFRDSTSTCTDHRLDENTGWRRRAGAQGDQPGLRRPGNAARGAGCGGDRGASCSRSAESSIWRARISRSRTPFVYDRRRKRAFAGHNHHPRRHRGLGARRGDPVTSARWRRRCGAEKRLGSRRLSTSAAHDVIVDHPSASATDENLSASGPRFAGGDTVEACASTPRGGSALRRISSPRDFPSRATPRGEHSKDR